VLLSIQHSGSARYYSGRVTIRWTRERFAGRAPVARFDRPPLVELPLGNVRVYDLD
jgi:hypothetical protein